MKLSETKLETIFGQRAVPLSDGRTGLRGGLVVESKADDAAGAPVIEFTASDDSIDRYDEVIVATGWDLANYRRNPVFQNSHKYGDVIHTLGKAVLSEVRGNKLVQRIEFATGVNPIAKLAYDLYRGKFLNAVSVGFIPLEWEEGSSQTAHRRKFLKQELLELSAVSVPANPNALQNAVKAGAVDKSDLRDLAEFLKQFCSDQTVTAPHVGAPGTDNHGAQLLQLARDVQRLLRA